MLIQATRGPHLRRTVLRAAISPQVCPQPSRPWCTRLSDPSDATPPPHIPREFCYLPPHRLGPMPSWTTPAYAVRSASKPRPIPEGRNRKEKQGARRACLGLGEGLLSPTSPPTAWPRPHLLPGSTEHRLLDVGVHAAEGVIPPGDALQVAQSPVLVPHHFLHHGWIPGKLHGLAEKGETGRILKPGEHQAWTRVGPEEGSASGLGARARNCPTGAAGQISQTFFLYGHLGNNPAFPWLFR